ncbi:MAG TPA: NAD-dependent epimerase/dehydratase family protein, partial [Elusimicrobiota bacterium]|nr:NAD-dependent epimerase/dehydratase family protein [Elusimicrobiota bacterium]
MEKSILLTGASGGFGRCLVAELHARGHRVLAALRGGENRGESLFPDLVDSPRLKFADLDLCDPASIH